MTSSTPSVQGTPAEPEKTGALARLAGLRHSLSGQVMGLTLLVVMLAEVFIYVPSIARFRLMWLEQHVASAQIAVLAVAEAPEGMVSEELAMELLRNAGVYSVALLSPAGGKTLFLGPEDPPVPLVWEDLTAFSVSGAIIRAFESLSMGEGRTLGVRGEARFRPGSLVEIVIDETPLCAAMIDYSRNILLLSLAIALATGIFVYVSLMRLTVRPIEKIMRSMEAFRRHPDDSRYLIQASGRTDEFGRTERELYDMQRDLQSALQQRKRLADLGMAVSKVNHDLRNILTSAQLVSDQLATIDDPRVKRLGPKLFGAVDRAVDLCTDTLKYGRVEEAPPHVIKIELRVLVEDVGVLLGLDERSAPCFLNDVEPGQIVEADQDQLFRILMNLARNADQALRIGSLDPARGEIHIDLERTEEATIINVRDNGPGIPETLQAGLFKPFSVSATPGGMGLGLAIARELSEAHGGSLALTSTGGEGTCFSICLPARSTLNRRYVEP